VTIRVDVTTKKHISSEVEPAHLDSSPRLDTDARILLDLFQELMALCFQW
jgi:hypothetical protein